MSSAAASPESSASGRVFRFGPFDFHVQRRELRKHGLRIKLSGQPVSILAMLLERPGEIITREDLQKRLWPEGTYVDFEHSVNAAIKRLRQALSDSADSPRFIETLARNGYRFIAPVTQSAGEVTQSAPEPVVQRKPTSGWRRFRTVPRVMAGILLVIAIAGFLAGWAERRRVQKGASAIRSLAVLPLANLSGDPGQEYFVEGMADALRQHLEAISALRVVSRTSSTYYRGSRFDGVRSDPRFKELIIRIGRPS